MCVPASKGTQWSPPRTTRGSEDVMAGSEPKLYEVSEFRPARGDKHVHHGRTPAAWAGSAIALVGFLVGAAGLVFGNWPVFWAGGVVLVVALIVTIVLQKMGKGAV